MRADIAARRNVSVEVEFLEQSSQAESEDRGDFEENEPRHFGDSKTGRNEEYDTASTDNNPARFQGFPEHSAHIPTKKSLDFVVVSPQNKMQQIPLQQIPVCGAIMMPMPMYGNPQYVMAGSSTGRQQNLCPPEKTLWMGSIDSEKWDSNFITEAFGTFDFKVQNVKMVTEKGSDKLASYCFVEFVTEDDARGAMLKANGRTVPNDPGRRRFNLSFANSPGSQPEYSLFVTNLAREVDDVTLFKIFGEKYKSCRGAKVYRSYDGRSKESGFVRFTSETDQQLALVEMNKMKLKGKEMTLRLFSSQKGRYQSGSRVYQGGDSYPNKSRGGYASRNHHRSRSPRRRSPKPKKQFFEPVDPPTAEEHNEHLLDIDWDSQMAFDSARFSKCLIPADVKTKDLAVKLFN